VTNWLAMRRALVALSFAIAAVAVYGTFIVAQAFLGFGSFASLAKLVDGGTDLPGFMDAWFSQVGHFVQADRWLLWPCAVAIAALAYGLLVRRNWPGAALIIALPGAVLATRSALDFASFYALYVVVALVFDAGTRRLSQQIGRWRMRTQE
jgi:hypothetical protein